jgi:flavin reductase (DIM6/NTAB) family NADH-FMN oxidoreductase RutF
MTVAWHAPISYKPPLYGVSISPKRFTYQLIADSKEFGVNFLPLEAAELVASVGGCRGQEIDKFQRFNIATERPARTAVPTLKAAYAAYECRLVDDTGYGDHRWLVGEIAAVHLLEEVFPPGEVLDLDRASPLLFLGNERYLTTAKNTIRELDRKVYGSR